MVSHLAQIACKINECKDLPKIKDKVEKFTNLIYNISIKSIDYEK